MWADLHGPVVEDLTVKAVSTTAPARTSQFSTENGIAALARHFEQVQHSDVVDRARFREVSAIAGYLQPYGDFATFTADGITDRFSGVRTPFDATYRHGLIVART